MLEEELRTLKEFIDMFMERGWIQESMSPTRALVMFVPKKNGKKRLVVDYQRLNDITIKVGGIAMSKDKVETILN